MSHGVWLCVSVSEVCLTCVRVVSLTTLVSGVTTICARFNKGQLFFVSVCVSDSVSESAVCPADRVSVAECKRIFSTPAYRRGVCLPSGKLMET